MGAPGIFPDAATLLPGGKSTPLDAPNTGSGLCEGDAAYGRNGNGVGNGATDPTGAKPVVAAANVAVAVAVAAAAAGTETAPFAYPAVGGAYECGVGRGSVPADNICCWANICFWNLIRSN